MNRLKREKKVILPDKTKMKYTLVDKSKEVNIIFHVFNVRQKKSLLTRQQNPPFVPPKNPYSHKWESTFRINALLPS
jgi:hypothetical protein